MSCLIKVALFTWGLWAKPDSLTMWFLVNALGHMALAWPLEGLVTEVSHLGLAMSLWPRPTKNAGHQSPGELPWLAILYAYCHTLFQGGVHTVHCSTERGQLEALWLELSWTLPYMSLPMFDLNLYPFAVINHSCEYNSFLAFSEFWESF